MKVKRNELNDYVLNDILQNFYWKTYCGFVFLIERIEMGRATMRSKIPKIHKLINLMLEEIVDLEKKEVFYHIMVSLEP